jgi:diaminopimelate epimerase
MSALANHPFVKMNGLGNEIVIVDMRAQPGMISAAEARAAAQPCGVPYDQLLALHAARMPGTDGYVRIYNCDGSEAGACGNGMRCLAELLFTETGKDSVTFETKAGLLHCWKEESLLVSTVDMGKPRFAWNEIPLAEPIADTRAIDFEIGPGDQPIPRSASALSMGNPHAVFWVEDVDACDLGRIGPLLENHPLFPERANISLAQVMSREHIAVRTWERGAGLTKACGSAACAVAVAAARLNRAGRTVRISLPGGDLRIEWRERDDHVLMTGPVEYEYEGRFDPALFAAAGAA